MKTMTCMMALSLLHIWARGRVGRLSLPREPLARLETDGDLVGLQQRTRRKPCGRGRPQRGTASGAARARSQRPHGCRSHGPMPGVRFGPRIAVGRARGFESALTQRFPRPASMAPGAFARPTLWGSGVAAPKNELGRRFRAPSAFFLPCRQRVVSFAAWFAVTAHSTTS